MINRREFLASSSAMLATTLAGQTHAEPAPTQTATQPTTQPATSPTSVPADLRWHDVRDWGVEGKAFADTAAYFDRLPARAKEIVRPEVWTLSKHTAGMIARFLTDATSLYVRYTLLNESLAMPHMPATGASGLDLYTLANNRWQWAATCIPRAQTIETQLISLNPAGERMFQIYLPLYNGVKSLEIGVPRGTTFVGIPPRTAKPIVWYGTSITQGACASRPGLAFTNILSRRLDAPIYNFGFSGNGRTEIEVGRLLAEIDAGMFVIDTIANTVVNDLEARLAPLVHLLRNARPDTPILLLEDRSRPEAMLVPEMFERQAQRRIVYQREFRKLVRAGVTGLHYLPGHHLIGMDGEGTVDGSHPNDLGMMRYADALDLQLRSLLR